VNRASIEAHQLVPRVAGISVVLIIVSEALRAT
jgi:hypothetical protein